MGTTYHLFNAQRVPVGRMAVLISQFIRGKNKPTYRANEYQDGDKCVIVNIADPLFTGRKRQQKIYRHHTGYPGGLKEYTFKTILEKNPERIINDAIMGMLPKNTLRKDIIKKNVITFRGPYHTM
jgi:large subunit ribosomal protein L13